MGGTSTCCIPFFAWIWALIFAAAAAGKNVNFAIVKESRELTC